MDTDSGQAQKDNPFESRHAHPSYGCSLPPVRKRLGIARQVRASSQNLSTKLLSKTRLTTRNKKLLGAPGIATRSKGCY